MSDIRKRSVVGGSKAAPAVMAGAYGAGLATVFLNEDEKGIRDAIKKTESMKDRLKKLVKFTAEDHAEFRAVLEAKRLNMGTAAKAAGFENLGDYFTKGGIEGQVAKSLQVTISLWLKMSKATQNGFKPDYEMAWADISSKATQAADAKSAKAGEGKGTPVNPAAAAAEKAKTASKLLDKAKSFVKVNLRDDKGQPRNDVNRAEMMALMCLDCTVEELDAIIARLTAERDNKVKARELAAKATAKASVSSQSEVGNVGVPVQVLPAKRTKAKGTSLREAAKAAALADAAKVAAKVPA